MQPADTSFAIVTKFLEAMSKATSKKQRDTYLERLMTQILDRTSDDCYSIIRLILPFVSSVHEPTTCQYCDFLLGGTTLATARKQQTNTVGCTLAT